MRILLLIPVVLLSFLTEAKAEPRLALLVGAADTDSESTNRSVADANLVSSALQRHGFKVTNVATSELRRFNGALAAFKTEVRMAGPSTTCLFYYSGRAVHHLLKDYLLPSDANVNVEGDLDASGFGVERLTGFLESAGCGKILLILEVDRMDPWPVTTPMLIAILVPKVPVYYAYATKANTSRAKTKTNNSLFTTALVDAINAGHADLASIFSQAREAVMKATANSQQPEEVSYLSEPFRLAGN